MAARKPLSREFVLATAVGMADREGIERLSMRRLASELGVVPMALYKHVANKEALLGAMADAVIEEIEPAAAGPWKDAVRARVMSARRVMLAHPWAAAVIASRGGPSPIALTHMDSVAATFLAGGVSPHLTHQAMHALGSRLWGFNLEVFGSAPPDDPAVTAAALGEAFPHVLRVALAAQHDPAGIVGQGCDDQFEFEFGVDVLLDGIERLHTQGWPSVTPAA